MGLVSSVVTLDEEHMHHVYIAAMQSRVHWCKPLLPMNGLRPSVPAQANTSGRGLNRIELKSRGV